MADNKEATKETEKKAEESTEKKDTAKEAEKKTEEKAKEIIYVIGNHDVAMRDFISHTFENIKFVEEYCFEENGRKFRIEHGDKYEKGIVHFRLIMQFISLFQDTIEKIFDLVA